MAILCRHQSGEDIGLRLRGSSVASGPKDTKVREGLLFRGNVMPSQELFSYPDLMIVRGEPQFHDQYRDVLLNPRLLSKPVAAHRGLIGKRNSGVIACSTRR